jgi:hypothetical protein
LDTVYSSPILIILAVAAIFFAAFDAIKTGCWKSLSINLAKKDVARYLAFFVPIFALYTIVTILRGDSPWNILILSLSMLVPFLLTTVGFSSGWISSFLLLAIVSVTAFAGKSLPQDSTLLISLGLFLYKSIDLLFFRRKTQFEDVIPAITWLSTLIWFQSRFFVNLVADQANLIAQENIVLLVIAITFGLKPIVTLVSGPDRFFLKRIGICALGGAILFGLTNFILLKPIYAVVSALYAGGLFTALLPSSDFRDKQKVETDSALFHRQLHFVILIGILALVGSRSFSMLSFLVLAPTAMVASVGSLGAAVAFFWTSRVLLQTFVLNYNSNVTGINLMHPYVSASMFAGFFLGLLFTVALTRPAKAWQDSLFFLAIAVSSPIVSNYFLHEEPTSGFLSSLLTAFVLLVCLAPLLSPSAEPNRLDTLILLPAISLTTGLYSNSLLTMGNESSTEDRIQLALYLTCAFAAITLVSFLINVLRPPEHRIKDVVGR